MAQDLSTGDARADFPTISGLNNYIFRGGQCWEPAAVDFDFGGEPTSEIDRDNRERYTHAHASGVNFFSFVGMPMLVKMLDDFVLFDVPGN